jgi:hypothetical protein
VNIADSPAVVSIAASLPSASEAGPTNGQFTFTRSGGNLAAALIVNYTVGGTATNGVDYSTIGGSITILANQTTATLAITVLQDNVVEAGGETVVLTLTPNAAYTISGGPAQVNIADSPAVVSIAASLPSASEAGPTNGQFTFTRSGGNLAAALVVNYSVGGTATNGVDYSTIGGRSRSRRTADRDAGDRRTAGQRGRSGRRDSGTDADTQCGVHDRAHPPRLR